MCSDDRVSPPPEDRSLHRVQMLAAQLVERLDERSGTPTQPHITRAADAGRRSGVVLSPRPVSQLQPRGFSLLRRRRSSATTAHSRRRRTRDAQF